MGPLFIVYLLVALALPLIVVAAVGLVLLRVLGVRPPCPADLWRLAVNRDTKRNLALAHATINHLEGLYGATEISAQAAPDGFRLERVPFSEQDVVAAAHDAKRRLRDGERGLRLRPWHSASCLLGVLGGWVLLGGLLIAAEGGPQAILVGVFLVLLLSRFLGRLTQRVLTTSWDANRLHIHDCHQVPSTARTAFQALLHGQQAATYWVSTSPVAPASEAASSEGRVRVQVTRVQQERC